MNPYANIEDYILFRGDLTFTERPFNLIDNLVLNELSYVDFSTLPKEYWKEGILLQKAGEEILKHQNYKLKNLYGGEQNFFELAIRSRRFGTLQLREYEDVFSPEDQTQFAAVIFDLDETVSYIAYRGTDDSIIGWKEDFMISFTRIRSQELAAQYLQKVMRPDHKYYVGGHSKGGNLALYACSLLDETRQKQVIRIFDNDGPCFAEDVFDTNRIFSLNPKVTRIIPSFCIIGKIYEMSFTDTHIVEASNQGVNCHDMISWKLNGIELLETDHNDAWSDWLIGILMEWARSAAIEERKIFVDEVFAAFQAGGAQSVNDITHKGFLKVLKAMSQTSPTAKKIAESLVKTAIGIEGKK